MRTLIKSTSVRLRQRPGIYQTPGWDKNRTKAEKWRNERITYENKRWQIGLWYNNTKPDKLIIGLLLDGPYVTHYAFYLKDVLDNPRTEQGIHFDAGTSRAELFIEPDEWKRVLYELDLIPGNSHIQSETEKASPKTES
jgi:hypothetical protein